MDEIKRVDTQKFDLDYLHKPLLLAVFGAFGSPRLGCNDQIPRFLNRKNSKLVIFLSDTLIREPKTMVCSEIGSQYRQKSNLNTVRNLSVNTYINRKYYRFWNFRDYQESDALTKKKIFSTNLPCKWNGLTGELDGRSQRSNYGKRCLTWK